MRILMVMDPGILVPPKGYGGHERLVYMFAKEYVKQNHQVDLLVTEGSVVEGCKVFSIGKEEFPPTKKTTQKAVFKAWKFLRKHRKEYDIIHNFGRLIYLLPIVNSDVQKIMTYGREISSKNIQFFNKLPQKNLIYTGCSNNLISRLNAKKNNWTTVYNAIDFSKYTLNNKVAEQAPLIFLGRVEKIKGAHTAITIAKKTGNTLIIAGNVSPLKEEQAYFENEIKPHIDNEQIKYVGTVNDEQKNNLLRNAKALLFPIEWNEPFGMVMVEAMACGTPVIGFAKGSVPEVIDENITGYIVNCLEDMQKAISKIYLINRENCRKHAMSRFDVSVIAKNYLSLFN